MSVEEVARALGTSAAKVREIERRAVTKFVREALRHGLIDRVPTVDELRSWEWASRPPRDRHDADVSHGGDECLADGDTDGGDLDPYRAADVVDPYRSLPSGAGGEE